MAWEIQTWGGYVLSVWMNLESSSQALHPPCPAFVPLPLRVGLTAGGLAVHQFSATHQTIGQLTLPFVSFQFYFKRMISVLRGFVWYSSSCVIDMAFLCAHAVPDSWFGRRSVPVSSPTHCTTLHAAPLCRWSLRPLY